MKQLNIKSLKIDTVIALAGLNTKANLDRANNIKASQSDKDKLKAFLELDNELKKFMPNVNKCNKLYRKAINIKNISESLPKDK